MFQNLPISVDPKLIISSFFKHIINFAAGGYIVHLVLVKKYTGTPAYLLHIYYYTKLVFDYSCQGGLRPCRYIYCTVHAQRIICLRITYQVLRETKVVFN